MFSKNFSRSDMPTSVIHWVVVIAFLVNLATGLRIAADNQASGLAQYLTDILPQGAVFPLHISSALVLLVASIGYVIFVLSARVGARIRMDRSRWRSLMNSNRAVRWRAINALLYWLAFGLLILAMGSGAFLYYFNGGIDYSFISEVHVLVAWMLVGYVVLHITAQLFLGGFTQLMGILIPRAGYIGAGSLATLGSLAAGWTIYASTQPAATQLTLYHTDEIPVLDGKAADAAWSKASRVRVHTVHGANQPGGESEVLVSAVHDGTYLYSIFRWQDTSRSLKHLPLQKTEQGWKVLQTEYAIQDEDSYYEDKFAVMLAHSPEIAGAGTTHLGARPLADKPAASGGRGLHYSTDGSISDVWHWKAVRSGGPQMQQIDDNYFGPPREAKKSGRYTGGYWKDPKQSGGFSMNWQKYSDDVVTPKRLPKDPASLDVFREIDLAPEATDKINLSLSAADTVPYSEELDTYPVGTIMPSVITEGPFIGDRGDVTAVAHWDQGYWTMEVKRKLDTGSEFDVAVTRKKPVYLWVSAFDHAQTRHSWHLHPIELIVE